VEAFEKMNGVVFGRGFLGTRIAKEFGYDLSSINITDVDKLREYFYREKPEIVINCAGKTGRPNIDWCETHKEETILSNATGPAILGALCAEEGIYFVHFGSGCVYYGDNNGKGYSEKDEPNHAENVYTRTKIYSEKILSDLPCLQIRPRMPIDDKPNQRNFIDKIKNYSKLINEQNSMTCVPDLINALRILINKKATGIYNLTNPGTMSAAEVMTMYKEIVDPDHKFEVISAEELDKMVAAKRSNCMLNTSKLEAEGIKLPNIRDAVRSILINYKKNLNNHTSLKGIILAGGTGSRLGKLTSVLNKHLVAVGDKPMIEYPLATLKKMGVKEIIIVSGAEHVGTVLQYLTKEHPDIDFTYKVQKEAGGIAQALSLVEDICKSSKMAVILGDNLYEEDFSKEAIQFENSSNGAMLLLKAVSDPERFGVADVHENKIWSIEEKPKIPKSNLVVTGLYFYGPDVFDKIKRLTPSARGEYEISEVNQMYVNEGRVAFKILNGFWSDMGTYASRKRAEDFLILKGNTLENG
jgi:glucose-1-phosphate thymidylyltransferase